MGGATVKEGGNNVIWSHPIQNGNQPYIPSLPNEPTLEIPAYWDPKMEFDAMDKSHQLGPVVVKEEQHNIQRTQPALSFQSYAFSPIEQLPPMEFLTYHPHRPEKLTPCGQIDFGKKEPQIQRNGAQLLT